MLHDYTQRVALTRHELSRSIHQRPDRRDATGPDDLAAGDQRPQPVRDVDHLLARQTGEEVFVASREPDDLVGEHRADNQRHVALDDEPIDADVYGVVDPAAGQLPHEFAGQGAHMCEGVVIPPRVVAGWNG